ncbi:MAG TPA: hypothetical protein VFM95_01885 [Microcella sp.]|nr:hypothetical protein [Microcella sp.]
MTELSGFVPLGFLFVVLLWAGVIAIIAIVTYQVIWRAVRRGLREYYGPERPPSRSGGE